ncbi:thioredoxin family protein [Galbibacter sp. EGI 63066]|uniref:thioredoxin family protein n=1 Tax=Galbibacter sp. EGI 63066 TaxID=2993559 RepID=UPI002248842C|nr:thioredoxin family protein [Galbibacter sp. EGI 63066]MCX2681422.1 thioredoxin family protein [Galbibacter sp. EGI 63066]
MKFIVPFFFLVLFNINTTTSNNVEWLTDISEAKHIAKKENKNILMYFTGSDWCSPCKMLKEDLFDSDRFAKLSENYVLVKVDIPRRIDIITPEQLKKNRKMLGEYNEEKVFPKMVFLNHRGKKMDEVSGYNSLRDPSNYFEIIEKYK